MEIKLEKINELPNAKHPNNIEVGYVKIGKLISTPKVGEQFYLGYTYRTSVVVEIINENTFKTLNSIYRWTLLNETE